MVQNLHESQNGTTTEERKTKMSAKLNHNKDFPLELLFGEIFIDNLETLEGAYEAARFLNGVENTNIYVAGIGVNQYYVIKSDKLL